MSQQIADHKGLVVKTDEIDYNQVSENQRQPSGTFSMFNILESYGFEGTLSIK